VRWISLVAGIAFVALAFAAATRVADTRDGLIAEVVTLFSGLAGVSLVLYGLFASRPVTNPAGAASTRTAQARPPSARDLAIGAGGLALAAILLGGLFISAGWQWAALGLVILLPMIAGSAYLCGRFLLANR
jgi:hypothetical protein